MSWTAAVATVVSAVAIPYGYTLAIWASGTLAVARYGFPRLRQVLAFVAGAMVGYLVFDLVAMPQLTTAPTFTARVPSLAALNILPIIPALGAALAAREVRPKTWGFLVVGAVASGAYILSLIILVWLAGNILGGS